MHRSSVVLAVIVVLSWTDQTNTVEVHQDEVKANVHQGSKNDNSIIDDNEQTTVTNVHTPKPLFVVNPEIKKWVKVEEDWAQKTAKGLPGTVVKEAEAIPGAVVIAEKKMKELASESVTGIKKLGYFIENTANKTFHLLADWL